MEFTLRISCKKCGAFVLEIDEGLTTDEHLVKIGATDKKSTCPRAVGTREKLYVQLDSVGSEPFFSKMMDNKFKCSCDELISMREKEGQKCPCSKVSVPGISLFVKNIKIKAKKK